VCSLDDVFFIHKGISMKAHTHTCFIADQNICVNASERRDDEIILDIR
jgi:hypothetical protein